MFCRVVVLALLALVLWGVVARGSGAGRPGRVYVVRPGDNLWSIAETAYGGDPREGVWRLQELNGLRDATLSVGQRLLLPAR